MANAKRCCICGRQTPSWNNPEPVRSAQEDCCPECNHFIVGAARREAAMLAEDERERYFKQLQAMSFLQLCQHFGAAQQE